MLEERYERLDDGSQLEYAHLKKAWQLSWSREDGVSTVLPYDEDIHRVGNPGGETVISVEAPRHEAYSLNLVEALFCEFRG